MTPLGEGSQRWSVAGAGEVCYPCGMSHHVRLGALQSDRDLWLAERRASKTIGSSTAADLLGYAHYTSAAKAEEVWLADEREPPNEFLQAAAERGIHLEDGIIQWAQECCELPGALVRVGRTVVPSWAPWLSSTPDCVLLTDDGPAVCDVKAPKAYIWNHPHPQENREDASLCWVKHPWEHMPLRYYVQLHLQAYCLGLDTPTVYLLQWDCVHGSRPSLLSCSYSLSFAEDCARTLFGLARKKWPEEYGSKR